MKKLFEKAKKNVALGVEFAKEMTGTNFQDDISVIEEFRKVEKAKSDCECLHKSIMLYSDDISKLFKSVINCYGLISQETQKYLEVSLESTINPNCSSYGEKMQENIENDCLNPLTDFIKSISEVQTYYEKRKKNLILYRDVQFSRGISEEQDAQIEKRKSKYENYQVLFLRGAKDIQSRKTHLLGRIMNSFQLHSDSFFREIMIKDVNSIAI